MSLFRMSWRESLQELPKPQRKLLQGGGLSQRFLNLPLDATHPAIIGALYGLLVGLSLILPIGYLREWDLSLWWRTFVVTTLFVMTVAASLGLFSRIIVGITARPPISPPRKVLYPMPFVGLAWLSLEMTELLEFWIWGAWLLLLIPGPLYIHLSWAPRWRLLCRLEDGLDPFDGKMMVEEVDTAGGDEELAEVVAVFDEEE